MRNRLAIAAFVGLGAVMLPGVASAAEDEAPYFLKRPKVRRWRLGHFGEYRPTLVGTGVNITHGVELSYTLRPHLRVGGSVVLPIAAGPGYCYQDPSVKDCTFNSFGVLGFAELHASTKSPFDPWIRAGVGNLVHVSRYGIFRRFDFVRPEFTAFASGGLDVNAGPVYVGVYGTIAAFVGEQAHVGGGGVRIGARF